MTGKSEAVSKGIGNFNKPLSLAVFIKDYKKLLQEQKER